MYKVIFLQRGAFMRGLTKAVLDFRDYLWQLNTQTKKIFCLNFAADLKTATQGRDTKSNESATDSMGSDSSDSVGNQSGPQENQGYGPRKKIGLFFGPALFLILFLVPTPTGMSEGAQAVLASAAWIATWWITEAIPIPVTSLLPIVLFPITGAMSTSDTTTPYANDLIFLFMGGFVIAIAMEKWDLHRRIALIIIKGVGSSPKRIILGFMIATGFLSMWISNTATTMMMTPIGLAVIWQIGNLIDEQNIPGVDTRRGNSHFGQALMLGIAYSASIGGVATIIGTPPNAVFVGVVSEMWHKEISFVIWMTYGVPLAVIGIPICWYYLTSVAFKLEFRELPGGLNVINNEIKKLGPISKEEKWVLGVFIVVALLWMSREFIQNKFFLVLNDASIAFLGAIVLFLIPVNFSQGKFLLDWETTVHRLPWGILILFGGGLSLASGFESTGLAEWIAQRLSLLQGFSMLVVTLSVVGLSIFLTEITSNTATATMLMPVMASMACAMGIHPYAMMIAACVSCSFAFMLPIATPPNAIVFGSNYITMPQMAKTGLVMNLVSIVLITVMTIYFLPEIWNINLATIPAWAK